MMVENSPDQNHRLSKPNFARVGLSDPVQEWGFGNPLRAILELLRLATQMVRREAGLGLLSQLLHVLLIVIVIIVLLLAQEDPEVGMAL